VDLLENEAFVVRNALLTAQGTVCAFQQTSESALCDLRCAVVGYGRIAKFLCRLLAAHGARLTVTARRESDLALIDAERMRAVHIRRLAQVLPEADAVFNTVPHHVFGEEELRAIRPGVTLMELASPPYGMDLRLAEELGVSVRVESGLPGRYFPVSAARVMLCAFESEDI
jgi:dipicolinate synthase subunit A